MVVRAVYLCLAAFGATQIARDAAAASLRTEALRYREEAIRVPSGARLAVSVARALEGIADRLEP